MALEEVERRKSRESLAGLQRGNTGDKRGRASVVERPRAPYSLADARPQDGSGLLGAQVQAVQAVQAALQTGGEQAWARPNEAVWALALL